MINPCAVKGISIFLETARLLPGVRFGATPGWGATAADLPGAGALAERGNSAATRRASANCCAARASC